MSELQDRHKMKTMSETDTQKLREILTKIDSLKKDVERLLGHKPREIKKKSEISEEAKSIINSIRILSANELENKINSLGYKDLGDIYVGVGGISTDKRKPKAWLIERIMWLSKGFSEGHKSIRES